MLDIKNLLESTAGGKKRRPRTKKVRGKAHKKVLRKTGKKSRRKSHRKRK
tara:strand:- start:334 stop:483 length:150 start_codon:yes stop_codon:yes gene_type:complete